MAAVNNATVLLHCMPHSLYIEAQDPTSGRITKPAVVLHLPLRQETAAFFAELPPTTPIATFVALEVLLADGSVPMSYNAILGELQHVAPPKVDSIVLEAATLRVTVRRSFPHSSSHGGSPMRIVACVLGSMYSTNPFFVGSKGYRPLSPKFEAFALGGSAPAAPDDRDRIVCAMRSAVPHTNVHVLPLLELAAAPYQPPDATPYQPLSSRRLKRVRKSAMDDDELAALLTSLRDQV